MIKNIIFDIGNVLVDFCWEEYLNSFHFPDEIAQKIAQATVLDDAWNEFDRGGSEEEELIAGFVRNAPELEKEIRLICKDVHDMLRKRDYAIPWLKELKSMGYGVHYLSNFSRKAERECAHAIDFIPYMDGGILSYREQLIKPDSRIYQLLLDRYHLIPDECVFLDDKKENCEAAEKMGIYAIPFTTKENAIEELKKLGVY
jgi:putative hydrolase of the HAD superfamily